MIVVTDQGTTIMSRNQLMKLKSEQFTPDWEHPDTRVGIEYGIDYSKAGAMVALKRRSASMSSQDLWAALNPTARRAAYEYIVDVNGARGIQARWAELEDSQAPLQDAISRAFALNGDLVQALERTVRRHAVGVTSERIHVHNAYMLEVLAEVGWTTTGKYTFFPDFEVAGHQVRVTSTQVTPDEARVKAAETYERVKDLKYFASDYSCLEEYVEERLADGMNRAQVAYPDTVRFFREGKKYVNHQVVYIAPMSLTDAQAEVYESFREDGMPPLEAEQAALAV